MLSWIAGAYAINFKREQNPEWFYKKVLLTPKAVVFAALPLVATYLFLKRLHAVNYEIFQRNAGNLSDIELLQIECRINPNK